MKIRCFNRKYKKSGSLLLSAVLATVLFTMLAGGYFATVSSGFNAIKSTNDALQAQQYAEIEANKLRLMSYANLDSASTQDQWKDLPDSDGWQYHINLSAENVIDADNKQRIASIEVRKADDTEKRFSLAVPLSSRSAQQVSSSAAVWGERENVDLMRPNGNTYTYLRGEKSVVFKASGLLTVRTLMDVGGTYGLDSNFTPRGNDACFKLNNRWYYVRGGDVSVPIKKGDKIYLSDFLNLSAKMDSRHGEKANITFVPFA